MLLIVLAALSLTACHVDENKVEIQFRVVPKVAGALDFSLLTGTPVTFTEVRNQDSHTFELDAFGRTAVVLTRGIYNISIERRVTDAQGGDVVISLRMENVSVNADGQQIEGLVSSLPASALGKDFIFSEIFFNGETNSGRMMHPDQYFVLFNPTEETLYADGISVGVTMHLSWQNKQLWYDSYYPDRVPIGGFITLAGSGKDYPVAPGEKIVVAFTAIDHSAVEGYDHAVDLSGADFEIYFGPESNDVDNPAVPNVLITENGDSYGFFFHPRGYVSPVLFRLKDGLQATVDEFVKNHTTLSKKEVPATETTPPGEIDIHVLAVNTDAILDGVQTSDVPQDVKTRVIPEVVDRGKFLVNGCHRQELCIRKAIPVGEKIFYKDTNNSEEDFEMKKGQNAFPVGWRKK